ncbi:MAG: D-alanine--D-alanine ligase [Cytophagales bacterium]|nr:D-alanine--D-alanine ligase [Cytophagales bacterium]
MIKVGIFFGGRSREREISFAGGRTVYDNLDKSIFEAIPVFVDSLGQFIMLDWQYIYKGTIRDFYPPAKYADASNLHYQLYIESLAQQNVNILHEIANSVGKKIMPHEFAMYMDVAFLTLHGPYGEDGNIQGILEWYGIPYTGCGILPSAIGIDKVIQKSILTQAGFSVPDYLVIHRNEWNATHAHSIFAQVQSIVGTNIVVKAPHQGSSIGVSVLQNPDIQTFIDAVNKSLFIKVINSYIWKSYSNDEKTTFIRDLTDIRTGIGMPVMVQDSILHTPADLIQYLDANSDILDEIILQNTEGEDAVLVEQFIQGEEFSCIIIQDASGKPLCLPPTQIIKPDALFDYKSKYLPGISRKITPIDLPLPFIYRICEQAEKLYTILQCNVYARIDGFFAQNGNIYLNDPNTTSGMLPSSFFFHQAAEIGLNPSQILTYIIHTSLAERTKSGKEIFKISKLYHDLEALLKNNVTSQPKKRVGVIMGGYSTERHISVESGRNIFEKLASSTKYEPIPIFLTGNANNYDLYKIPVNIMLKDNADDIRDKILTHNTVEIHPVIAQIRDRAYTITEIYSKNTIYTPQKIELSQLKNECDMVFIALHGRPGEDGDIQSKLDAISMPYNGSGVQSSSTTIDKYITNEILLKNGISVAKHMLVLQNTWGSDTIVEIEKYLGYPLIAKPHDEGCSSAVKKIKNREQLIAFATMMFRDEVGFPEQESQILNVSKKDEFPQKVCFLVEELIASNGAAHFLEVTGGMLIDGDNFEVFEPSEALAVGEVLTLEEKFLAGEGQNITPARFSKNSEIQKNISTQVKNTLKNTAQILGVQGYCRIDAFVRIFENNTCETIIIEVNSLPGMTPATCIFHQAAINQYKPYEFIDRLLQISDHNHRHI